MAQVLDMLNLCLKSQGRCFAGVMGKLQLTSYRRTEAGGAPWGPDRA